jgi:hypothetical protein
MASIPVENIFPIVMVAISLAAAGVYFFSGDIPKGIYWVAASTLTTSTMFM